MEKNLLIQSPAVCTALDAFLLPGPVLTVGRISSGHINETYCVSCRGEDGRNTRLLLQGLSQTAFPHPDELMDNFIGITGYLRERIAQLGGDPSRETLTLVNTKDGANYFTDENGKVWRMTYFIEGTVCPSESTPELFEASARAFGRFQYLLKDYPAQTLHETIRDFHNTEARYRRFEETLAADPMGRAALIPEEVAFIRARREDCSVVMKALRDGTLPLRVTHNDTKLNNILFDEETGEGVCIIDLDTTMPGLSVFDFGDSIRFGANHCREDEKDLSLVNFDLDLFERYTRGFLDGVRGGLTDAELDYLPWGARIITLECGMRFLTDYLDGDRYFRTNYPEQNLDRCRTQFKLVRDMEERFDEMQAVVARYRPGAGR